MTQHLAFRVGYPPRSDIRSPSAAERDSRLRRRPRRWDPCPAVLAVTICTDGEQRLQLGAWELRRFGRVASRGFVLPDGADLTPTREWAANHPDAAGRFARDDTTWHVHHLTGWRENVLRPHVVGVEGAPSGASTRAWLVSWDIPWVLSRLAGRWAPGRGVNFGAFSCAFFDRPEAPGELTGHPRLILRAVNEAVCFSRWGRMPSQPGGGRRPRPGPVLDLRHITRAVAGNGIDSLDLACRTFEVTPPDGDGDPIASLADRVHAIGDLARAAFRECDEWEARQPDEDGRMRPTGIPADPRNLYSGGGLATSLLRTIGVPPLAGSVIGGVGHDQVIGAFAAASHGGWAEARTVRHPTACTHWDIAGEYGTVGRLGKVSDLLLAARRVARDVTAEATVELDRLHSTVDPTGALLDPAWWGRWLVAAVQVRPHGAILPARTENRFKPGEFSTSRRPIRVAEGGALWTTMADLAANRLAGGPRPEILRAVRVEGEGRSVDLRPVVLPLGRIFDPAADDLFGVLLDTRRAARSSDLPGFRRERLTAGVKGLIVGLATGATARVDTDPLPERPGRRHNDSKNEVVVIGPDGERITAPLGELIETPGVDYFPPASCAISAGGRLLAALVVALAEQSGGLVHQVLTDAFTVEGGDMPGVAGILADRIGVELRPEHGTDRRPITATVLTQNRYLFTRGARVIHTSEYALGGTYLTPFDGGDVRGPSGARTWVEHVCEAVAAGMNGIRPDGQNLTIDLPVWANGWALSPIRGATPKAVAWLGPGALPFDQGLAGHWGVGAADLRCTHNGAPVARAAWSTPVDRRAGLVWRHRDGSLATPSSPATATGPDAWIPGRLRHAIHRWATSPEAGKTPVAAGSIQVGALEAVGVDVEIEPILIGREGTEMAERSRDVGTLDEPVIAYLRPESPECGLLIRALSAMTVEERDASGISERARQSAAAGRLPRKAETVLQRLGDEAVASWPSGEPLPADPLERLEAWVSRLETCRAEGCDIRRDGRSELCVAHRRDRHRVAVAAAREKRACND